MILYYNIKKLAVVDGGSGNSKLWVLKFSVPKEKCEKTKKVKKY